MFCLWRRCCVVYTNVTIQSAQRFTLQQHKLCWPSDCAILAVLASCYCHAFSVGLNAMAKTSCTIAFDNNPQKVFFGGQTLSGRVVLTLRKEKTVRGIHKRLCINMNHSEWNFVCVVSVGISIKIDGKAYCRWTQGSGDSKKTYIGEEVYLSERTYVVGDKTGKYYKSIMRHCLCLGYVSSRYKYSGCHEIKSHRFELTYILQ